jgi:hypothetical protein
VEGLVRVFGQYFVNMAKTPSVNNNTSPKPRRRPKWRRNCCTRPQKRWTRINKVLVGKASHGWNKLIQEAYDRKRQYGKQSFTSCLTARKQLLTCDFDASVSALVQDLSSSTVRPHKMDAIATAVTNNNSVIAISATISSLGRKPQEIEGSISKVLSEVKTILPNASVAYKEIFQPALRLSMGTAASAPDNIRGSHRFHLGFADHPCNVAKGFNGLPREENGAKAWYPRIHHEHMKEGASMFLTNVLPIVTKCFELCDTIKPGFTNILEEICHPLVFPFQVALSTSKSSLTMCLPTPKRECQRFFTRMSVSTIAGKNVTSVVSSTKRSHNSVLKGCNEYISSMVHRDCNDIGKGGLLHPKHGKEQYINHGRDIISGSNDQEILQLVIAISYKCHSSEGLAVLPDKAGDEVFVLQPPAIVDTNNEEVRLQLYALDYSYRLHANMHPTKELHPDAWCVRLTCYATVHAATWSHHIKTLSHNSASDLLSSIYQAPGFNPLPNQFH